MNMTAGEETETLNLTIGPNCDNKEQNKMASHQLWYIQRVVAPVLGHYLDIPSIVHLDDNMFPRRLYQIAQESGNIPPHRSASWSIPGPSKDGSGPATTDIAEKNVIGLWLRDYRQVFTPVRAFMEELPPRLTVEIKPKAAYTASSPLVAPSRRIKYGKCRYEILHGHSSNYNPLDLFSQSIPRVQSAIQELLDQPRNNFRLWLGTSLYTDTPQNAVSEFIRGSTKEVIPMILAFILSTESEFLRQVQNLQKLDVVDSDGAVLIYERLVYHWMDGSHLHAERLVDFCSDQALESGTNNTESSTPQLHCRLEACPPALVQNIQGTSEVLNKYLDLVTELERKLENDVNTTSIDRIHNKAIAMVNQMNQQDCVLLLHLW
jgi:hypothetical protein